MALLFMDGFDHYRTSGILKKWLQANLASTDIYPAAGRRGGGGLYLGGGFGSQGTCQTAIPNTQTIIIGHAVSATAGYDNGHIDFLFGATVQCSIRIDTVGTISAYRSTSTLLGSSVAGTFSFGAWHYLEVKLTISDTVGAIEVRLNGVTVLTLSGVDTKSTTGAGDGINGVLYRGMGNSTTLVDDLYICDTTGTVNNDFLGDVRIDLLNPSGSGTHNGFTKSISVAELTAAYTYWRLWCPVWNGSGTSRRIYEIELRATPGGADQCSGGTPTASSFIVGYAADRAFDNNTTTDWRPDGVDTHTWIQYQFATPVSVAELAITEATWATTPVEVWLQGSNDGVAFKTLGVFFPDPLGAANSTQTFAPVSGTDYSLVAKATTTEGGVYLIGGAAGTKETFTLTPAGSLPAQNLVVAVQVNSGALKTDAGGAAIRNVVRSGTFEATGPTEALTVTSQYVSSIHEINPATGQPWFLSEATAMEAGVEVVV